MNAKEKIRVFVSSRCGGKYEIVRKAIQSLIEETGLATAFVFETASGSSQDVQSAYLNKVDDCNLFLLLVDNADDITPAVLSEIKRAEFSNKKMLCFFCNEIEKKETELQQDLIKTGKCKFEVVSLFSDLVNRAYVALIQDIIDCYIAPKANTSIQVAGIEDTSNEKITYIDEAIFKEFSSTKKKLSRHCLKNSLKADDVSSEIDNAFGDFLQVLLCEKKYNGDTFRQLKTMIIKLFNGHMRTVIEHRLEAVRFFFMEDLNSCLDSLQKAVEFIKNSKSIPTWVLNDVALDLRNVLYDKEIKKNQININNIGQNIINATKEPIVFPILDRIASNISKDAINHYNNMLLESPYTTSSGGINEMFDKIGDYYCRALMFGSITHLRNVLTKYNELLLPLCLEYEDKSFTIELIKNYILLGDSKALDKFLRTYNQPALIFYGVNLDQLLTNINYLPLEEERIKAKLIIVKYFGYLLSDKCFDLLSKWLFEIVNKIIKKPLMGQTFDLINDAIKRTIFRLNQNDVMDYIVECLSSNSFKVLLKAFQLMTVIHYKKIDNQRQINCKNALIKLYSENTSNKSYLNHATICFCLNCSINYNDLEEIIKEKDLDFYEGDYKLELSVNNDAEMIKQVKRYVSIIENRNKTQGVNCFTGYLDDPYTTIWNIINRMDVELEHSDIEDIVLSCLNTLFAPKQGAKDKIRAMSLLLNLRNKFSYFDEWGEINESICTNKTRLYEAYYDGFIDKTSKIVVNFAVELLLMSFEQDNNFIMEVFEISTYDEFEIIGCLNLINGYLKNISIETLSDAITLSILQLCIGLSRHKERDIKLLATKILIQLTRSCCKEYALKQLSMIFDMGTQDVKIAIVSRINKIDSNSSIVDYIKQKARVDSNFLVRELINAEN